MTESFVCADAEAPVHIKIDFKPEYNLEVELVFEFYSDLNQNNGNSKMDIATDISNKKIIFKLYNANNPFGIGNMNALPIATLGGKNAYLSFRFSRPEDKMARLFTYSIFTEKGGE